jgi:DNA-binding beta-propeller fold protein YncE
MNPAATRLYVTHQGVTSKQIAVFGVSANGDLAAVRPGSPFSTSTARGTYGVSVNPAGTRLYVTSQEAHGVFVFALDANGDISAERAGSPFLTGIADAPLVSVVHPAGKRLYVTDQGTRLVVYTLDANGDISGQQTGSPFAGATASGGIAINRAGTRVYVGDFNRIVVYPLDAATGDVTGAGVPFSTNGQGVDLAIDSAQAALYIVDSSGGRLVSVLLDTNGDPTTAQAQTMDAGVQASAVFAR